MLWFQVGPKWLLTSLTLVYEKRCVNRSWIKIWLDVYLNRWECVSQITTPPLKLQFTRGEEWPNTVTALCSAFMGILFVFACLALQWFIGRYWGGDVFGSGVYRLNRHIVFHSPRWQYATCWHWGYSLGKVFLYHLRAVLLFSSC